MKKAGIFYFFMILVVVTAFAPPKGGQSKLPLPVGNQPALTANSGKPQSPPPGGQANGDIAVEVFTLK